MRHKQRPRPRREQEELRRNEHKTEGEEDGKPELTGILYIGPQMDERKTGEDVGEPELEGKTKEDEGVIREIEDMGYLDDVKAETLCILS